jgi:MFS family permease
MTTRNYRRDRWRLGALSLTMLLSSVGTSIANVALPSIAISFHAAFRDVQWVVIAYLLSVTTLMVGVGRLGDILGRRRLLLASIGIFLLASAACAVAPDLLALVAARAAQGLGAAGMMALSVASIGGTVAKDRLGSAMGLLGTMSAIGTALGPSLGGALIAWFGWPSVFAFVAIAGVTALALSGWLIPADRPADHDPGSFDIAGTALLALSLGAYALTMTIGGAAPVVVTATLALVAVAGAVLFGVVENRAQAPLVSIRMLRERGTVTALIAMALVSTIIMATLVVGPFYLSHLPGFGPAAVGMVMSIGPAVAAATGIPAGRIVDRVGAARTAVAGLTGVTAGAVLMAALPMILGAIGYVCGLVIVTASYAVFQAANTTLVMNSAAPDRRGVTSGLLGLARNLGLITGTSAMPTLYAIGAGSASGATGGVQLTFAAAAVLGAIASLLTLLYACARDGA